MNTLWQDLRYGVRMLLKNPGFTAVAVITLALGIGANTAIFSVVYGVLLRPLPFKDPEWILTLWQNDRKKGIERDDVSPANFLDWKERAPLFEQMVALRPSSVDYTGTGEPEVFYTSLVSSGFFELLGIKPFHGRTFLPEEYVSGKNRVIVLSYGLWQRKFGGDPSIVGRALTLDGAPHVVVGIMPPEFRPRLELPEREGWLPFVLNEELRQQRGATYLQVIARPKSGVTLEQAQAEMDTIAARLAREYPQTNSNVGVTLVPLPDYFVGSVRPALLILLGAVGFVLLIACANVANLLLARGAQRARELAVRATLGASRTRLVRQLLNESLLLAALGCAGGLGLAGWGIDLLVAMSPGDLPQVEWIGLHRPVLAFTVGVAILTALLFGLAPAGQVSRLDLQTSLKEGASTVVGVGRRRLRSALVISEVSLAFVLLVSAGLLLRSFVSLLRVHPGFQREHVVALQVFMWDYKPQPEQRAVFVKEALAGIEALPGMEAAGAVSALPFLGESSIDIDLPITIEGQPSPPPGQAPTVYSTVATAGYFHAMRIPLLRGRSFNEFDTPNVPPVVLINETMARRFWPTEDPIGKKFTLHSRQSVTLEIVGVVGDVRHTGLDQLPRPEFFRSHSQYPFGSMTFVVRTASDPTSLLPAIKKTIWELSPAQTFYLVATLEQLVAETLAWRRFTMLLLGIFAALALVLAAVGIYGVMAYSVTQQTHEIGIRMALGAESTEILKLVLKQGLSLSAIGIAIGLTGAFLLTRVMESLVFGVSTKDALTFSGVALLLAAVAVVATYIPARRATRVDPIVALRYE